jgi:hypothetical protein
VYILVVLGLYFSMDFIVFEKHMLFIRDICLHPSTLTLQNTRDIRARLGFLVAVLLKLQVF